jgi:hypothetical protein
MIELYRPVGCSICAEFEATLKEMVVAHKVIVVEKNQNSGALPPETPLPALKENGHIVAGPAAIAAHLQELEKFVADWRRFQTDACYIGDDGGPC